MKDLDYYALSRFFGAKMVPIKSPVFGHFGLVEVAAEAAKVLHTPVKEKPHFTLQQERLIVQSFEKIRDGLPPEALLWDAAALARFVKTCQRAGLDFPQEELVRRLQAVRKNPTRYAKLGIRLKHTARREHFPTVLAAYAPVIEFSLVRLRYRYGCSIDEILIDSALGAQLEKTAQSCVPTLLPQQIRQAALTLRKKRFLPRHHRLSVRRLKIDRLEGIWSRMRSLDRLDLEAVPSCGGILEMRNGSKELFVSRNENLHDMVEILLGPEALSVLAGPFWFPNRSEIEARFIPTTTLAPATLERWELKLLTERKPVFNWPIGGTGRAA